MELLSAISVALGVCFVGLVAVAMLVAGWEALRQRELLDQMRRDRALYAATSPLPLSGSQPAFAARQLIAAGKAASVSALPRDGAWTETRPTVLSFAPAADDSTARRQREVDLQLD